MAILYLLPILLTLSRQVNAFNSIAVRPLATLSVKLGVNSASVRDSPLHVSIENSGSVAIGDGTATSQNH